jgi:hypothetical protein
MISEIDQKLDDTGAHTTSRAHSITPQHPRVEFHAAANLNFAFCILRGLIHAAHASAHRK